MKTGDLPAADVPLRRLLVDRGDRLRGYIQGKLPSFAWHVMAPEDILQEVYSAAFRHFTTFVGEDGAAFDRWIITIANNRIRDAVRRAAAQHRARVTDLPAAQVSSLGDFLQRLAGTGTTPSSELADIESVSLIRAAIDELEPDQRQAIWLHEIETLTVAKVAEAMLKTPAAVRGLLERARDNLRVRLGNASRFFTDADSDDQQ